MGEGGEPVGEPGEGPSRIRRCWGLPEPMRSASPACSAAGVRGPGPRAAARSSPGSRARCSTSCARRSSALAALRTRVAPSSASHCSSPSSASRATPRGGAASPPSASPAAPRPARDARATIPPRRRPAPVSRQTSAATSRPGLAAQPRISRSAASGSGSGRPVTGRKWSPASRNTACSRASSPGPSRRISRRGVRARPDRRPRTSGMAQSSREFSVGERRGKLPRGRRTRQVTPCAPPPRRIPGTDSLDHRR
jgi:hypothetical protein